MPPIASALAISTTDRVRFVGGRLILRDKALFRDRDQPSAREFLARAFSLPEVRAAVVRSELGRIDIVLNPLADPSVVWRRLGALLRERETGGGGIQAHRLPLQPPAPGLPVRVSRAGRTLTTFRVRALSSERLRIAHPLLRRRDFRRRLLGLLNSINGVNEARAARLWASVIVSYDPGLIDVEQLLRLLDDSWALLMGGAPIAPPPKKLALAGGLLALSFTAQFFRPALLPWATAAVAIYSLPNVIAAIRDLRRGRVGLPALYSASLGFLLWTGLPFASSVIATLTQLWPALANALAARVERRLFAEHHRRLAWARLDNAEIDVADLRSGAIISAAKGDYLPVDGIIVDGFAAIDEDILTGARGAVDRGIGDAIYAGTFVRDGVISVKTVRVGSATAGAALARALPNGTLSGLPSSVEVERVANRNARPALLAAGLLLLATRTPRLSQVVMRPDYATAPRLSAHLSALTAIAESLVGGALVRNPPALDRLLAADVCVFDDGAYFTERGIRVAGARGENRIGAREALTLAASALAGSDDLRSAALRRETERLRIPAPLARDTHRVAGAMLFRDEAGALISVGTPSFALEQGFRSPTHGLGDLLRAEASSIDADSAARPLAVARGRDILGLIRFDRHGPRLVLEAMTALRTEIPEIRFVHLSSAPQREAEESADEIGLDAVFGGLGARAKWETVRSLGSGTIWVGDGGAAEAALARAAAAVSVSIARIDALPQDMADIVLLRGNLDSLLAARRAAERRLDRLRADYRVVYLANLAAVGGGFAAGFGSLQAGLVSNLGSAAVFLSRWRSLMGLAARAERIARARSGLLG